MAEYDLGKAVGREDLCRFLAACFYEPEPEFTEERLFDSMLVAAQQVDPSMADQARKLGVAFAKDDLQTLLVDYTRLFLGPVEILAKPYGRSWLNAPVSAEEDRTQAVLEMYSEGGFDIDEEFRDLPDHIAVELEFLYLLIFQRNEAESEDQLRTITKLEQRFLDQHLGLWVGPFCAAIKNAATTDFYRTLAELVELFVRREADTLS